MTMHKMKKTRLLIMSLYVFCPVCGQKPNCLCFKQSYLRSLMKQDLLTFFAPYS